jgi:hypothetical protein
MARTLSAPHRCIASRAPLDRSIKRPIIGPSRGVQATHGLVGDTGVGEVVVGDTVLGDTVAVVEEVAVGETDTWSAGAVLTLSFCWFSEVAASAAMLRSRRRGRDRRMKSGAITSMLSYFALLPGKS